MMTRTPSTCRELSARTTLLLAAAALLLAAAGARAADTTVYRCPDGKGRVLYTDVPCRNAEVVDLRPGEAAPGAAQRLAAAQAELDAGMQAFRAAEAAAAAQRAATAFVPMSPYAAPPVADTPYEDFGYWPWYGGGVLDRPDHRPRPPARPPHVQPVKSVVPATPPRSPRVPQASSRPAPLPR